MPGAIAHMAATRQAQARTKPAVQLRFSLQPYNCRMAITVVGTPTFQLPGLARHKYEE